MRHCPCTPRLLGGHRAPVPPTYFHFPATSNHFDNPVQAQLPGPNWNFPNLHFRSSKGKAQIAFWDSYNSAIHSNGAISDINNFNYLKSLVKGPAARIIQGLNLTKVNYNSATELLKDHFGKPQQIISAPMDDLLKIPHHVNDKPHSLTTIYNKISIHTRGLASLGVTSKQYGSLLIRRIQIARN